MILLCQFLMFMQFAARRSCKLLVQAGNTRDTAVGHVEGYQKASHYNLVQPQLAASPPTMLPLRHGLWFWQPAYPHAWPIPRKAGVRTPKAFTNERASADEHQCRSGSPNSWTNAEPRVRVRFLQQSRPGSSQGPRRPWPLQGDRCGILGHQMALDVTPRRDPQPN